MEREALKRLKYFLIVSVAVYAEIALAIFLVPSGAEFIEAHRIDHDISALFFTLILLSVIGLKNNAIPRSKIRPAFMILNAAAAFAFTGYLLICTRFNFAIPFRPVYLISMAACHYALFTAFFEARGLFLRYFFAAAVAYFLTRVHFTPEMKWAYDKVWRRAGWPVSYAVFWLLKICGFRAVHDVGSKKYPVVGTDRYSAEIWRACSGIQGMVTFLIAFTAMAALNWKVFDKKKVALAAVAGSLVMYAVNIARIYILILIGHFTNAEFALKLWHSQGSLVLYVVVLSLLLNWSYNWMRKPATNPA
jgi:exosortase/archaeosortase family protein